jgi:hypothetical protein
MTVTTVQKAERLAAAAARRRERAEQRAEELQEAGRRNMIARGLQRRNWYLEHLDKHPDTTAPKPDGYMTPDQLLKLAEILPEWQTATEDELQDAIGQLKAEADE